MGRGALTIGGVALLGPACSRGSGESARPAASASPFGELVKDPGGILDLPKGFQYRVLSMEGAKLADGTAVPGAHDGMAAFAGPGSAVVLVRNHELAPDDEGPPVPGRNRYSSAPGGTTGIVVDPNRTEVRSFVTSSGSSTNCAGGETPWGTWVTCEETRDAPAPGSPGHGYAFEVMHDDAENDLSKTPILDMGFFSHEAIAVDPRTGIVYLTEDDFRGFIPDDPKDEVPFVPENVDSEEPEDGGTPSPGETRVSYLYRYLPNDRAKRPGALQAGGKLQVMKVDEKPHSDLDVVRPGREDFRIVWVDVNPQEPHEDAERLEAARFNRLEGCRFEGGAFWFDDTAGGKNRLGQIFRLTPGPETETAPGSDTLELFYEGTDANKMESPDNITITPWGDLWFAEDGDGGNRVMGITPEGEVYQFANNRLPVPGGEPGEHSEFAGPCFSPDGRTFFVNIQTPGHTFAIWGPFPQRTAAGARRMAAALPPAHLGPRISGELSQAADQLGISPLEAAALDRLGMPLV